MKTLHASGAPSSGKPDLAAKEGSVVGTFLSEFPAAFNLPPYCALLLEHAPDSFDDLRLGVIARAIRQVHDAGKPVCALTVREQLTGELDQSDGGAFFFDSLPSQGVGITIAEFEASELWEAYRKRRLKSVYGEAAAAMEADPTKADTIAAGVRICLEALANENADSIAIQLLQKRQFNPHVEPPPLRPIYTLAGICISTPANLTTITSAIKTGKSAVIGAMAAAAMPHGQDTDLLGFSSSNPKDMALLWFDSEQSPDDFWHGVYRALKRAGLPEPPPWLHAYCLTGLGHKRAWECVTEAIKAAADLHGGVHSTLIDGFADLVADVNDPEESNAFVAELHDSAIKYDCPIIGVIHFNPGSDKSRGHLGSQVERKAETNLALEKDSNETTVIYSIKNRRAGIPKNLGPRFAFSKEAGMHLSIESRQDAAEQEEIERLTMLADDLFADHSAMHYTDLVTTARKRLAVSDRTAARRVGRLSRLKLIKKTVAGLWIKGT